MTKTAHVWQTTEENIGSLPGPSAEENCEHVRARMAQEGLNVTQEPLGTTEAIAWLRTSSWAWHEVLSGMSMLLARPGRIVLCGLGWRLFLSCRRGPFTLLQIGRA